LAPLASRGFPTYPTLTWVETWAGNVAQHPSPFIGKSDEHKTWERATMALLG
jgi:hypothetical protein